MKQTGWYSIGFGSNRAGRAWSSYVSAQGDDLEQLVGALYRCAMAVAEPFTQFGWEIRTARNGDAYAKLTALADSLDCIVGGPLHTARQSRIHKQLHDAGEEAFAEQRARR